MNDLVIETSGSHESGVCGCCGHRTRRVWGYVWRSDHPVAAYFVEWTLEHVDSHGANFDLIIGRWGEGATAKDRQAVSLEFRVTSTGPAFMIIDAENRPVSKSELVGKALSRADVIGDPLSEVAFAIVDAVWLHDPRIGEIKGNPPDA